MVHHHLVGGEEWVLLGFSGGKNEQDERSAFPSAIPCRKEISLFSVHTSRLVISMLQRVRPQTATVLKTETCIPFVGT